MGIRGTIGAALISLLLYFSGFLVWLTPLPFFYSFRLGGRAKGALSLLLPLALLCVLYLVLVPWVSRHGDADQVATWFFWLPGVTLGKTGQGVTEAIIGIGYFCFFSFVGILLEVGERRAKSVVELFRSVCLPIWALFAVVMIGYTWLYSSSWIEHLEAYFRSFLFEIVKVGPPKPEIGAEWQAFKDSIPQIAYFAVRLLPGVALDMSLFVFWLNLLVGRRVFSKSQAFASLGNLTEWQAPFFLVWLTIVFGVSFLLNSFFFNAETIAFIGINAFLVLGLVFFFQGLAIISFYAQRWKFSILGRFLIYLILVVFFQPLGFLLVALGFFDSWFDFRKLSVKDSTKESSSQNDD